MTTANVIVEQAMYLNGSTSPIKPAHPLVINQVFGVLVKILNEYASKNIDITGLVIPTLIGDDLEEPDDSTEMLIYNLAVRSAPYLQKQVSMDVKGLAKAKWQDVYNLYGPDPQELRKNSLPVGSGNKTYIQSPVFYPEGYENSEV